MKQVLEPPSESWHEENTLIRENVIPDGSPSDHRAAKQIGLWLGIWALLFVTAGAGYLFWAKLASMWPFAQ